MSEVLSHVDRTGFGWATRSAAVQARRAAAETGCYQASSACKACDSSGAQSAREGESEGAAKSDNSSRDSAQEGSAQSCSSKGETRDEADSCAHSAKSWSNSYSSPPPHGSLSSAWVTVVALVERFSFPRFLKPFQRHAFIASGQP